LGLPPTSEHEHGNTYSCLPLPLWAYGGQQTDGLRTPLWADIPLNGIQPSFTGHRTDLAGLRDGLEVRVVSRATHAYAMTYFSWRQRCAVVGSSSGLDVAASTTYLISDAYDAACSCCTGRLLYFLITASTTLPSACPLPHLWFFLRRTSPSSYLYRRTTIVPFSLFAVFCQQFSASNLSWLPDTCLQGERPFTRAHIQRRGTERPGAA